MIRLRHILAATMLTAAVSSFGAPIDEAKKLYRSGQYEAAIEKLRPLLKRSPKDGTVNYYLGASLMATGERSAAVAPLKQAASRGVADASRLLAEYAVDEYRVDDADNYLEAWETQLKKSKKSVPEDFDQLSSRVVQLRNMLDRVEKIEIVDSLCVDSAMFFQAYRLSKEAGRLLPPEAVRRIGAGDGTSQLSVAYMPENHTEILWSAAGDDGMFRLYGADILDDGTIAHPAPLDDSLGEGGNAKFPFLMPDGVTLYFANDGENSLGGYDIFMTRRNDGENGERTYYQPQNIGMPYNSPFNDYMLAIDEMSGLGWWATDRNAAPGKVNIYIYIPSAMRVNASPDDPDLSALARLTDLSLTRKEGTDYKALLEARLPFAADDNPENRNSPRFAIDNGHGKVYTALSDFRNERARSSMLEALATESELRKHLAKENELREKWRKGDHSVRQAIMRSEEQTTQLRSRIASLRNAAVRLEK